MTIRVIMGMPGAGKSLWLTYKMIGYLKAGERVFTNYPIAFLYLPKLEYIKNIFRYLLKKPLVEKQVITSLRWDKKLIYEEIYDSVIGIDEGYRDFNSRKSMVKEGEKGFFDEETHLFFSAHRHNLNDLWLVSQNPARLDVVIREIAEFYCFVEKKYLILDLFWLWNTISVFTPTYDPASGFVKNVLFNKERMFFRGEAMRAYDTHYFRKYTGKDTRFESWAEWLVKNGVTEYRGYDLSKEKLYKKKEEMIWKGHLSNMEKMRLRNKKRAKKLIGSYILKKYEKLKALIKWT